MHKHVAFVVAAIGLTVASTAMADEPAMKKGTRAQKVVVLKPTEIVGRWRPVVTVDIGRERFVMPLSKLRHQLADRIEAAAQKDPY